jgi:hypothetical protein
VWILCSRTGGIFFGCGPGRGRKVAQSLVARTDRSSSAPKALVDRSDF